MKETVVIRCGLSGYWMELPGLRLASHLNTHQSEISSRIPRGLIADYYTEYVNTVGLSDR